MHHLAGLTEEARKLALERVPILGRGGRPMGLLALFSDGAQSDDLALLLARAERRERDAVD